jgi:mannose-6-phosphate isomerase-like protein (cupin superfamily)
VGAQLDVNVLDFDRGEGVAEHVNPALDVWLVVIDGTGEAIVRGVVHLLAVGTCLYIPAGAERAIRSTGEPLVYASAQSKRRGLMPDP